MYIFKNSALITSYLIADNSRFTSDLTTYLAKAYIFFLPFSFLFPSERASTFRSLIIIIIIIIIIVVVVVN